MKHNSKLLTFAAKLASREAGFVFATLGVIVQAFHTYYITTDLSSLSGGMKTLQAILMAAFISCALLYFTLKSSDADNKQAKKWRKTVMYFAIVETFINLYYWGNHCLIEKWPDPDYMSFIIAIPFSILLPFTLKAYGGEVRVDDPDEDDLVDSISRDLDDELELNKRIETVVNNSLSSMAIYANVDDDKFTDMFIERLRNPDFQTIVKNIISDNAEPNGFDIIDKSEHNITLPHLMNSVELDPVVFGDEQHPEIVVPFLDPVYEPSQEEVLEKQSHEEELAESISKDIDDPFDIEFVSKEFEPTQSAEILRSENGFWKDEVFYPDDTNDTTNLEPVVSTELEPTTDDTETYSESEITQLIEPRAIVKPIEEIPVIPQAEPTTPTHVNAPEPMIINGGFRTAPAYVPPMARSKESVNDSQDDLFKDIP